jgi:hypothetical protein
MKFRILSLLFLVLALPSAFAQDVVPNSPQPALPQRAGWQGQRNGRGEWNMRAGRGLVGNVTEVAKDHYTVKSDAGDVYTVLFSVNTRIMKQTPRRNRQGDPADAMNEPPTPPVSLKSTDIKVGDVIAADGEINASAKTVGAVVILLIDPERAKQLREMEANYGKTWLMGKVTAINDLRITVLGGPDNVAHSFVADENTAFRKRREPITMADVQVGDMVRAEGAVKNGAFMATTVAVMSAPAGSMPQAPRANEMAAPPL